MAWTTPRDWTDGELVTEALLDTHVRDNLKALTEWTTYTPTWTATGGTPTIGNGTLTGAYIQAGDLCHFWFRFVMGSTTSVGTTTGWTFGLPVAVAGGAALVFPVLALDSGTALYHGMATVLGGESTFAPVGNASGFGWGYNSPFTFVTNDTLIASGTYEC